MEDLDSDIIEECQDVFALVAKNAGLDMHDVGKCLRMLNLAPSEQDVRNIVSSLDLGECESIEFEDFLKVFRMCKEKCVINEDEVVMQLNKLAKDEDGAVCTEDLKKLLMGGDEPLTLVEAEALLNDFDQNGKVNLENFLNLLLNT